MWNIFKRPIKTATSEAWAKICDDCAKVAFLAIPVVLFGKEDIFFRIVSAVCLLISAYISLVLSKLIRDKSDDLAQQPKE